jgi:hypothetical protein
VSTNIVLGVVSSLVAAALIAVIAAMRKRIGPALAGTFVSLRLARRLYALGVVNVFGSRSDYQKYRDTPTLIDYFSLAHVSVEMVGYWISYGVESQGLAEEVCALLSARPQLTVSLAVIDPSSTHLESLAKHLNRSSAEVRERITNSLVRLTSARARQDESVRSRYRIKVYDSLPVASVVMLDRGQRNGRVQVDIKPYHAAQHNSFTIEFTKANSSLYQHLTDAWGELLEDAKELNDTFKPPRISTS